MKRSELKTHIKEQIIDILSEADADDIKAQQDLNKELETTKGHADDLISSASASDKISIICSLMWVFNSDLFIL
jgi:hypothetical protein